MLRLQNISIALRDKNYSNKNPDKNSDENLRGGNLKGKRFLLKDFSVELSGGDFLCVKGRSGSGKSTLLSFIGGFIDHSVFFTSGTIELNQKNITNLPVEKRGVGILFQDYLLFPHMTIEENLLFALGEELSFDEKKDKVISCLKDIGLSGFSKRDPTTLSGGEQARVALMRALINNPTCILLDEPFSKLDKDLRKEMRDLFFSIIWKKKIPTVLVTHDLEDLPPKKSGLSIKEIYLGE